MLIYISFIVLLIIYGALIFYYLHGWKITPTYIHKGSNPDLFISVIIPARNESKNIGPLLESIIHQSYSKDNYEVIVVDDHSTDETMRIAQRFPGVKVITFDDVENSYKKKAIETGISAARGTYIVCTDADCVVPKDWLINLASFAEVNNSVFVAAPVDIKGNSSVLHLFQELDFMMLQGITCASVTKGAHPMSNGANLAYTKTAFNEVKGFEGIDHIASGDDMLLMGRLQKKFPERVHYIKSKEVIVRTSPQLSWKELINQRIRWASKSTHYAHPFTFIVLLMVYLFNLSFLGLFIAGFWDLQYFFVLIGGIIIKTLIELPFFYELSRFFNKKNKLGYVLPLQPLHIIYVIISGLLGQIKRYEWKGRVVK